MTERAFGDDAEKLSLWLRGPLTRVRGFALENLDFEIF